MKRVWLVVGLMSIAVPVHAEKIDVPCEEYSQLTGQPLPCQVMKTIKVERAIYEKAQAKASEMECKKAVEAKYNDPKCRADAEYLWGDPKKPCVNEMVACQPQEPAAPATIKRGVNLWD